MFTRRVIPAVVLLLAVVRTPAAAHPDGPPQTDVPVVQVAGSGAEMGTSHGTQLGQQIRELDESYLQNFFKTEQARLLAYLVAMQFQATLSPAHREEVEALAKSSELDPREMMLAQCFLDLLPMTACSTITLSAGASSDGVARFGRNLDFPSFDIADKHSVILVFRPKDAHAFVVIGWPGMIGALSGMNEHGLTLANMEVTRKRRAPTAMPYTLLYRTVLEKCTTVNEALELLKSTPRQTANNLMLMDATGDRALVEITPEGISVRRAPDLQALVSTNHQRGQDLDSVGHCRRYDTLCARSREKFGKLDLASVQHMLADVQQGDMTLQCMIFEPKNRVFYLSTGKRAADRTLVRYDLNALFDAR